MLNVDLRLSNPFSRRWDIAHSKSGKITKHSAYELNHYRSNTIINLYLRIQLRGDHKGIFLMLGLMSHDIELSVYDIRHEE